MIKSKQILLLILSIIYSTNIFSGLLPETMIYTGNNQSCNVKNLNIGNLIVSSKISKSRLVYNNISGIKLHKQASNFVTLITLESKQNILSSLAIGTQQRFCAKINQDDNDITSFFWIEAEDLNSNMQILGYNNEIFKVVNVQNIELKNPTDLYEISLIPNNTFYILDSNKNLILTHNISWLMVFFITVGCATIIGGGAGAGLVIHKSYVKKVKINKRTVARGFLIGAATGAAIGAVTYGGIWLGVKLVPILLKHLSSAATYVTKTRHVAKPIAMKTIDLAKYPTITKLGEAIFIGTIIKNVSIPAANTGYNFINQSVEEFIQDVESRENEEIDLSGIDSEQDGSADDFQSANYQQTPGETQIFHEEPLVYEDGNQVLDENGNPIYIVFATYNN